MYQKIKAMMLFSGCVMLNANINYAQEALPKVMKNYIQLSYAPSRSSIQFIDQNFNSDNDSFQLDNHSKTGTFGFCYEHRIIPAFSIGMDVYYFQKNATGIMTEAGTGIQSNVSIVENRLKTQIRFAYHFPIKNNHFDVYLGGAIGSNSSIRNLFVNGNLSEQRELPQTFLFPVALRTYAGFRYSFTQHFGINAEVGIGGPMFNSGIHFRF